MDDMDHDDVQVHVTDEPMDISDQDLDGSSKATDGFKKLGKRRKNRAKTAKNQDDANLPSEDAATAATASSDEPAASPDSGTSVTAGTPPEASDASEGATDDIIPEPEEEFTSVDAEDLVGTKVRRLGRKKRATASSTFQLPASEVSQGLSYLAPANDHAARGPKEANEAKHFGQDEIDDMVAMLGDSLKDPTADVEALIDGPDEKPENAPEIPDMDTDDAAMMTGLSQDAEDIGSADVDFEDDDADALDHAETQSLTEDLSEADVEADEATMESDTAVSRESLERVRMLATKVNTGAPKQSIPRERGKLAKFFSRDSRGYAPMSQARKSMPMVSVARRMGVAAITAVVMTAGFVASAQLGADASDKDTASIDRLKTQLQELADASLTDEEKLVACTQVETESVAAVMEPSAAPRVSMRPAERPSAQSQTTTTDTSTNEIRPSLP